MIHNVRTEFGNLNHHYGGDAWAVTLITPPQGLGQGKKSSPKIWAIVSSPVLKYLWNSGHGYYFKLCISGKSISLVGYCFVDDLTIIQVSTDQLTTTVEITRSDQAGIDIFVGST